METELWNQILLNILDSLWMDKNIFMGDKYKNIKSIKDNFIMEEEKV